MRSIWKFPLDAAEVAMPEGAIIVHFAMGAARGITAPAWGVPTVWALVDSDNPPEQRRFQTFGTGNPIPRGARHVGTYNDGPFIAHVFEMVGEPLPDGLYLPAEAEAAYRTMTAGGFKSELRGVPGAGFRAWVAPNDEPLTTEQMMAVATLQDYGFGSVVSA